MQNPKAQKITKTEFAKYQNTWREYPYIVNMGAQKNFSRFATYIVEEWNKDESQFNELYFRNTVVIAIMYASIDRLVAKQDWYEKGYKANIVVYTLAYFHYLIKKLYLGYELNMRYIWDKQRVPEQIEDEFIRMTEFVFRHITASDRPITNVTEWCKKEQCWILLKAKEYELDNGIIEFLLTKEQQKKEKAESKKEHILETGIQVQAEVIQKGQEYWENALAWGKGKHLLSDTDASFLAAATKINYGRIPSEKQCQRIVNIVARLIDEGFSAE